MPLTRIPTDPPLLARVFHWLGDKFTEWAFLIEGVLVREKKIASREEKR